jgi:hypothetical protein
MPDAVLVAVADRTGRFSDSPRYLDAPMPKGARRVPSGFLRDGTWCRSIGDGA